MKAFIALAVLAASTGCTPGSSSSVGGGNVPANARVAAIMMNLTGAPTGATAGGGGGGYVPLTTSVSVGDFVHFQNIETFNHTGTSVSGTSFPQGYPFTGSAFGASGSTLSGGFSTGTTAGGSTSAPILADKAGTYLFGCAYHYGAPMRGVINVR